MTRLAVLALGLLAVSAPAADPPPSLELLALGAKPARVELRVDADGTPVPNLWDEAFAALFAFHDRDGNRTLDRAEAGRLPSAFALRQVAWGQFAPSGPAPAFADFDADADGTVTLPEVTGFYRRAGLGGVLVGVGTPPAPDALTDAILKRIDANADGKTGEAEWGAAAAGLLKLDADDDELVTPNELVDRTAYPGALGTVLLAPPSAGSPPDPVTDSFPLVRLGAAADASVVARRAGLGEAALKSLHAAPPAAAWVVRIGKGADPAQDRLTWADGKLRLDLRAAEGKLPAQTAAARKRYLAQFAEYDGNADGSLDAGELKNPKAGQLRAVAAAADRDADGCLSRSELTAWLDVQDAVARAHVLLTVVDRGAGLLEVLDADRDGALSVRELRTAWPRLTAAGCVTADRFDRAKLPRVLLATVSRGHPVTPLGVPARDGPDWFRAMDRNRDGDVSRREFTGDPATFDRLDADRDGLLSPSEAAAAGK